MNGCPFGLGSVVVTFNRYPTLITAMLRRMCGLLAAAYFDDNLLIDIACAAGGSKSTLNWGYTTMPAPPQKQRRATRCNRIEGFWGRFWILPTWPRKAQ